MSPPILENPLTTTSISIERDEILHDYYICSVSREISLAIRKDVLTGRAKFGVSDDGKELVQIAMAKAFQKGDFRSDYYRGHTLLLALDLFKIEDLFSQLYADGNNDPFSGGRQMNNHHATRFIDEKGYFTAHKDELNLSSDISTTAGQMARGIGLAFASKKYRESEELQDTPLSTNGNEVCFCNIGDASTSEGAFWETINAVGVMQVPMAITIMDDGYGISVPKAIQTTKESVSEVLQGFQQRDQSNGIDIYQVKGWDYIDLIETYRHSISKTRETHIGALIHVDELTQPQGHSTSGSHERYKSKKRLDWEKEFDCNEKFKEWILENEVATEEELQGIHQQAKKQVKEARNRAWKAYSDPITNKYKELDEIFLSLKGKEGNNPRLDTIYDDFKHLVNPFRAELVRCVRRVLYATRGKAYPEIAILKSFIEEVKQIMHNRYHTHLYSETERSALKIPVVDPVYSPDAIIKSGYEILNINFDKLFHKYDNVFAFGEDVGKIGDVNQAFAGLQEKHGVKRVFDTGIREWTIVGQALGMAMRGLRPIAEIQYLDYLIYGFSPLTDDVATLRWRSNNLQAAPLIIRTRGHRLEGVWHSGSPMSVLLGGLRGMYILVPRNMTQAAGMYNTMLRSDDPCVLIECLNAYRLKERVPDNVGEFTIPIGIPEVMREGSDITIVTYGACVRIAEAACDLLKQDGISVELIDVQTLLPFDRHHRIVQSLQKTNRIIFLDEDVPGGASAYMMQEVLEKQGGYQYLDSPPTTLSAKDHRPPYGTDGDYFSKPNVEDIYNTAFHIVHEAEPGRFSEDE